MQYLERYLQNDTDHEIISVVEYLGGKHNLHMIGVVQVIIICDDEAEIVNQIIGDMMRHEM